MDDGWGSSLDPWSNPTPDDILAELEAEEKKATPAAGSRRRASSAVDPWARSTHNESTAVPLPVWDSSAFHTSRDTTLVQPAPRSPASAPAWMRDDVDEGWGSPEPESIPVMPTILSRSEDATEMPVPEVIAATEIPEPALEASSASTIQQNQHDLPSPSPPSQSLSPPHPRFSPEAPQLVHDLTESGPPSPVAAAPIASWNPELNEESLVLPDFSAFPASPSFEDGGFGGFSSGPAEEAETGWGRTDIDGGWGSPDLNAPLPTMEQFHGRREDESTAVDAWGQTPVDELPIGGAERSATPIRASNGQEDEWEAERKAVERRETRAPAGYVRELELSWSKLAEQIYPETTTNGADPKETENGTSMADSLLAELSAAPSAINTFVQPLATTMTWTRYRSALNNSALTPETSLLAREAQRTAVQNKAAHMDDWERQWGVRSHLGEPEIEKENAQQSPPDAPRPGWSLWGKKGSNVGTPLTTSGGGLLEIKRMSSEAPPIAGSSSMLSPSTTGPSVFSDPAVPNRASSRSAPPPISSSSIAETSPDPAPRPDSPGDPAPSAVGRFFGRFRKSRPATPSVDLGTKDLALSADDFSFLAEVPSMPTQDKSRNPPGFVDLLSLESNSRPTEEIASLEAVLNSKSVKLPSALAPPPPPQRASSVNSFSSAGNSRTIAREIDLFADLDFGDTPAPLAPSSQFVPANPGLASRSAMSDFDSLFTAAPSISAAKPAISVTTSNFSSASPATWNAGAPSNSYKSTPAAAPAKSHDDFGDFGDFGDFTKPAVQSEGLSTAAANTSGGFDDFGDFGDFASIPGNQAPTPPTKSPLKYAPSKPLTVSIQPTPSYDFDFSRPQLHRSASALVSAASAQTQRWPAPASPIAPILPPPPGAAGKVDFFSDSLPLPSKSSQTAKPAVSKPTSAPRQDGTLSAQDLSFFDSL